MSEEQPVTALSLFDLRRQVSAALTGEPAEAALNELVRRAEAVADLAVRFEAYAERARESGLGTPGLHISKTWEAAAQEARKAT